MFHAFRCYKPGVTFRPLLHGLAGFLALGAIEWMLYATGDGLLRGPRLDDPGSWPPWLLSRPPDVALMALVRLLGLALGGYLLAVFALGLLLRVLRLRPLVAGLDRLTPTALRSFLDRVTGVAAASAVAVAGVTGTAAPAAASPGREPVTVQGQPPPHHGPPVTLRGLAGPQPDPGPTTTTTVGRLPAVPPPATVPVQQEPTAPAPPTDEPTEAPLSDSPVGPMEAGPAATAGPVGGPAPSTLGPSADAPSERRRQTPPDARGAPADVSEAAGETGHSSSPTPDIGPAPPPASDAPEAGAAPSPSTREVEPGDHFWGVAARTLAQAWGRPPAAAEVVPYWRTLIEANRSRLADPGNPDLLFPGQVLDLPPVPQRPAA